MKSKIKNQKDLLGYDYESENQLTLNDVREICQSQNLETKKFFRIFGKKNTYDKQVIYDYFNL